MKSRFLIGLPRLTVSKYVAVTKGRITCSLRTAVRKNLHEALIVFARERMMASISKSSRDNAELDEDDQAMAQFLEHRYGDGLVYLQTNEDRALLRRAIKLGFVNE